MDAELTVEHIARQLAAYGGLHAEYQGFTVDGTDTSEAKDGRILVEGYLDDDTYVTFDLTVSNVENY